MTKIIIIIIIWLTARARWRSFVRTCERGPEGSKRTNSKNITRTLIVLATRRGGIVITRFTYKLALARPENISTTYLHISLKLLRVFCDFQRVRSYVQCKINVFLAGEIGNYNRILYVMLLSSPFFATLNYTFPRISFSCWARNAGRTRVRSIRKSNVDGALCSDSHIIATRTKIQLRRYLSDFNGL